MLVSFSTSVQVFQAVGIPVTLITRHTNGGNITHESDKTQFILKAVKGRIA